MDNQGGAVPAQPDGESDRLRTLEAYGLAETAPEHEFDHFAEIAADLLGLPIGLVNLVGEEQVTVKGRSGLDIETLPRDVAFCSHALLNDSVMSVPDLARDPRFAANPLVAQEPWFRFYAGAPLVSPAGGHRIGTLCILGHEPRPALTPQEARLLSSLASLAVDRLELRRVEKEHRESRARFDRMTEAAPGAVICADSSGAITHWNGAAERLFGWAAAEAVGQRLDVIIPHGMRQTHATGMARHMKGGAGQFPGRVMELPALRRDGTSFPAHIALSCWQEGGRTMFGANIHDITARRAAEDRLRFLAHYDSLTGLANRQRLLELMGEAAAGSRGVGLILLDLDGFKHVNDTMGHGAGDLLLTEVGGRLALAMPDACTLARLGGDEFAVLLTGCDAAATAVSCARALQAMLEQPFHIFDRSFQISACAGIALDAAADATTLLANADLALYQAKAAGRGALRMFQPSLRHVYEARRALEEEVCSAVLAGEFVMHFQPQVRLGDKKLIGAEALLRWQHPQRGLLAPDVFLEALEAGRMVGQVGDWTIDQACRQAALWRRQGRPLRVAVNLFTEHVRAGTLEATVRQALQRWDLPPSALELEVTETIAFVRDANMLAPLHALHAAGVSISFDDFGTGFASLSTLRQCPLDCLKIDRSFVSTLGTMGSLGGPADRGNVAVIDAILALGRGLGLRVVAEGIETPEQAAFLNARGCDEGQGYLFGHPSPPDALLPEMADDCALAL